MEHLIFVSVSIDNNGTDDDSTSSSLFLEGTSISTKLYFLFDILIGYTGLITPNVIPPTGFFGNFEKDYIAPAAVKQHFDKNVARIELEQSVTTPDGLNNRENIVKENTSIGDHMCNVIQNSSHGKGTVDNNQLGMHLFL
jgi:hypothetical protein